MTPEERIEAILGSLDGAARAEAGPYFYSKLRNRLGQRVPALPARMAWRLALALALVAVLNLLTLRAEHRAPHGDDPTAQTIATEYSMTQTDAY